ncbi:YcjF family protein [uncultured Roseibium sp.]|uniref:YcjF family protein n=1 Tax=uncultured Roseibium sp. TaxID=1936171 RepID=UPI003216308D
MSKRLPRTSNRTLDDLRKAASQALEAEQPKRRSSPRRSAPTSKQGPSDPTHTPASDAAAKQEKQPEPAASAPADPEPVGGSLMVQSERPSKAAFRESTGRLIIERHANFAALAGLVPMPFVDLAAIAVIAERMLRKLTRLYGRSLSEDQGKRLALAMLTGLAAPGLASITTTAVLSMAPGSQILNMAITSASAVIFIRVIGDVYLTRLQAGLDSAEAVPA